MIKSFKYTFRQFICIVLALGCVVALMLAVDAISHREPQQAEAAVAEQSQREFVGIKDKTIGAVYTLAMHSQAFAQPVDDHNVNLPQEAEETAEATEAPEPTSPYASLLADIDDYDRETLTRLIYHECRGDGGEAVAEVVLNRMLNPQFPDTLQGVVYETNQFEPAGILFSAEIYEPEAFDDCESIVETVLSPDYERQLPSYYLYFNSIGPDSEDYCWLGGNVFYGYPSDAI